MLSLIQLQSKLDEFYDVYFHYVGETECARIYHRWSILSSLAALLGRQCWLPFGHWTIYPNMFVMLMGTPGARKSTAIIAAKNCLERLGYDRISADRTSKERFLFDMMDWKEDDEEQLVELILDSISSETFVVADEFLDFIGKNNLEFLTMLGKLWDAPPQYKHPKLHGKSIVVPGPTLNILAGNTPQNFMLAFPPESIGQGYMSRNLLIHGETTGVKITIPKKPTEAQCQLIDKRLLAIRESVKGELTIAKDCLSLLDRLYKEFADIDDYRFKHYSTRRFTHLLKLSMLFAATRCSTEISRLDCLRANTLLHYTELKMPKALGEFGKAKNADVANAILQILKDSRQPVSIRYLWKQVSQDLNRQEELHEIVNNLKTAGKIQVVEVAGKQGYQPRFEQQKSWAEDLLLPDFLTAEEKA